MKGVKDLILDESPKNVKKLEKIFEKDPESASYFDALKAEAGRSSAQEFTKFRILVTDSFVCYSPVVFGGRLNIVPITKVRNIYRTNIVRGEYNFDNFTLAVETDTGIIYLAVYPRAGAKTLDIFNEVIEAVRTRMAVNGGAMS